MTNPWGLLLAQSENRSPLFGIHAPAPSRRVEGAGIYPSAQIGSTPNPINYIINFNGLKEWYFRTSG
jgi:hypothetical protein